ncbi:hypothetical protein ACFQ7F_44535 [Streptomyces sp. NPDC056486]|uniref:hypothetical protein n=1 Tax=Streptomyces sp. NPDC056486 TaxID=3345835 RepID=UPI003673ED24
MDPFQQDEMPSDQPFFRLTPPRPITAAEIPTTPAATDTPGNSRQEFVENVLPGPLGPSSRLGPLVEDESPQSSQTAAFGSPHAIDVTRHKLAIGMLWMVGLIAGLPTITLLAARWTHFSTDAYREVSLVFTPVVALTSAAFGFFFASDDRNNRL